MGKKCFLIPILAFFMILPLGVSAAPITLTVAEVQPKDYPTTQGLFMFADLVKARSNGAIIIDVKYGGQLGLGEKKIIEQVQFGALDMGRVSSSPVSEFVPELAVFGLPYIWRDDEHMWKALRGEIGRRRLKAVESHKFYGLAYYTAGQHSFYTTKKPIKSVADLKGLKIRVMKSQVKIDLVNALGANATPMAFGEVYDALSKGVIDGADNNFPTYESTGHYKLAKYYTLDSHNRMAEIVIASKKALDKKLTPEQIKLVKQAAWDSICQANVKWEERAEFSKKRAIENGNTIIQLTPDAREEFVKAVQPVYEKYRKYQKLIDEIRKLQ
jgi:tripartite ATP-independent transporter DctP family solute receptor